MNFQQLLNFLLAIAPQLEQAISAISRAKGLPPTHPDVVAALAEHLTPGQPNEPSLS